MEADFPTEALIREVHALKWRFAALEAFKNRAVAAIALMMVGCSLPITQSTPDTTPDTESVSETDCLHSSETPICGNGVFARLRDGRLQTSEDRVTWTNRPLPVTTFLRGIAYGKGLFVAVGGSYIDEPGVIVTSHDGITWVRRHPQNRRNLYGVTLGNDLFVAVGDAGVIYTSADGVQWGHQRSGASAIHLATVVSGNDRFVAGGESGLILTSTNGVHWPAVRLNEPIYLGTLHYCDGAFIVGDRSATFTSTNGLTWRRRDAEVTGVLPLARPQNVAGKQ